MAKLHLVFGGVLKDTSKTEFANPHEVESVGIYPSYDEALVAWRAASQKNVDNALMRFFIADLSQLRHPE